MTRRELILYCNLIEYKKKKERFSSPEYINWVNKLLKALEAKCTDET